MAGNAHLQRSSVREVHVVLLHAKALSEVIVPAGAKMMMAPVWAHYAEIAFGKGLKARVAVAL